MFWLKFHWSLFLKVYGDKPLRNQCLTRCMTVIMIKIIIVLTSSLSSSSHMMTSSNGNIFHVTGPLCGEVTGEFPSQRPVTWSFDVFFDLCLNKRLSKQLWGWWFETPSSSLWHHCNDTPHHHHHQHCTSSIFIIIIITIIIVVLIRLEKR